ncbi:MAG: DNA polymerase IV [Gemmatimonadetes bacterium]|nr:MAG: DNA polymerase IV [Gemmatimonadota bacterium]PYP33757.1 MAG: DNA polymerase IV [Gemmatimonadota bacterium]
MNLSPDRPPAGPPVRRILLADADAFYVAVARLVDPDGAGRAPLLIVGGAVERRGVVTSASYEARAYGVQSAMPMARAVRLCPDALVVPVPWEACAEKGEQIRDVLLRFTPLVERASSDEFYLDLSGTERLYQEEPLAATARRVRQAVLDETTLSMSIGGATSKVVAKLAAGVAKPRPGTTADGVHVVAPGGEAEFLRRFSLGDLPLVGPKFQERLARLGLRTVLDVVAYQRDALIARLGEREGAWLYDRVRGIDSSPVQSRDIPQSLSRDETFPRDLTDDEALAAELLRLADRAAADLREAGLVARGITVKLRDSDFTTRQASRTLSAPVRSDRVVYAVARELLQKLRAARRVPARLLGVSLSQLLPEDAKTQLSLFELAEDLGPETERDRVIARVMDQLRERFGPDALQRGRSLAE